MTCDVGPFANRHAERQSRGMKHVLADQLPSSQRGSIAGHPIRAQRGLASRVRLLALLGVAGLSLVAGCAADEPVAPVGPGVGTLAAFCAGGAGGPGCCDGTRLVWCEGGSAIAIECGTNSCGYYGPGGIYDCYATEAGPQRACPVSDSTVCQPTCSGRCGVSDGCGGTCGCSSNASCVDNVCAKGPSPTACEKLMHVGCCDSNVRRFCVNGAETSETCVDGCGWNPAGWNSCGFSGSDPSGDWPRTCQ